MNISTISGQIAIKFELKHLWDGRKAAFYFMPDLIRSLVSMATDSSDLLYTLYLQVTRTSVTSKTNYKFDQIGSRTAELAALERLEKSP